MRALLVFCLFVLLTACRPADGTLRNAALSTPVADLPMAMSQRNPAYAIPTPLPPEWVQTADSEYTLLSNLYERVVPSVVNIEVQTPYSSDARRGSGFVYDPSGIILTNAHVLRDAESVRVTFSDGITSEAQLLGIDSYSDVGLLRVSAESYRLHALPLADSDSVRVGQRAITIGNPFGLNSSMTVGIISGIGRTLRSAELIDSTALTGYQNPAILQTDTPINPGNSGAPLLNSRGEVIGMTTAIRSDSGIFQGVGFAVPSNTLRRVVPELLTQGRVDYPWLGISVHPEDGGFGVAGLADALNLPVKAGVLVRGVTVNSPADLAGLRGGSEVRSVRGQAVCAGGDIIVAINDRLIRNMDDLVGYVLLKTRVGETISVRVIREGRTFDVPLTLTTRPQQSGILRDCNR